MTGKTDAGPARVADEGHRLSDARRRVLSAVADAGEASITVAEVASLLGGHPNGSRAHLEALSEQGLVSSTPASPTGRGRPALRYRITAIGRRTLDGGPSTAYRMLTNAFASHLTATGDTETAHEVGRLWARSIATGDDEVLEAEPAERLVELLASLDFTPEVSSAGDLMLLHTCPFVEEARKNPAVICGVHQGLIDGALESWGLVGQARLQPFSAPGVCGLRLGRPADEA